MWTYTPRMDESRELADPQPGMAQRSEEKNLELRKPHEMIVMVPKSKRVTLTGRRIYNVLLQYSQARLIAMGSMPAADFMFEASLPSVLRASGSSGEDRTAAKRYLKEMLSLEVDWESTAPGDGVKWRGFSMLSEVAIEVRNGENWVSWSFPPTIMAALREPNRWARMDLDVLAKLGSYTAVALYDICARYRDNPGGLTSRKPVSWWADALSQTPAGSERREWRKIKSERIKEAIDEINSLTDLEIELVEHKQGRTVVEAQFVVRRKRLPPSARSAEPSPVDANVVARAERLGVREAKLDGLITEFGEDLVREKLEVLEGRKANPTLRNVENSYSYLRSLLRTHVEEPEGVLKSEEDPPPSPPMVHRGAHVPFVPLAPSVEQFEADGERIAQAKREIQAMDSDRRDALVEAALHNLQERGQLNAVITRRAAQGDILHGLLGAMVVKVYLAQVH